MTRADVGGARAHPLISTEGGEQVDVRLRRVDERELKFSAEAPLVGWRLFRVRFGDHGFVLTAPLIHDPDFEWFPSSSITARCYERPHPAPAPRCRCGLYVAVDGTLDSLAGYLADSAHDQAPPVYAEVACTGRAFLDRRGVRVEQLTITRLATSVSVWTDTATMTQATADLTARYGIVIDALERVPAWVRDNVQPTGAPTSNIDVDLDGLAERLAPRAEPNSDQG
jgi:hypothetical protein